VIQQHYFSSAFLRRIYCFNPLGIIAYWNSEPMATRGNSRSIKERFGVSRNWLWSKSISPYSAQLQVCHGNYLKKIRAQKQYGALNEIFAGGNVLRTIGGSSGGRDWIGNISAKKWTSSRTNDLNTFGAIQKLESWSESEELCPLIVAACRDHISRHFVLKQKTQHIEVWFRLPVKT